MIEIVNILDVEKELKPYDAILFDLDDTLYSERDYVKSGYEAIAEQFKGCPWVFGELWNSFTFGRPAIDEIIASYGEELLAELNSGHDLCSLKKMMLDTYRNHTPQIQLYPGVDEILARTKSQGKFIGIVTDGRPEGQWAKIKVLKLEQYVNRIIVTDELGGIQYRKPCTLAFEIMHDASEVDYSKMVYVGDNIKKDFIAPEKLGMGVVWFRNEDGLYKG